MDKEITFDLDLVDLDRMEEILENLARQVERRLLELNLLGKTLMLKVTWSNFQGMTRSVSRGQSFQDAQTVMPVLRTLLRQLKERHWPVRLLGVCVSGLPPANKARQTEQEVVLSLWDQVDFCSLPTFRSLEDDFSEYWRVRSYLFPHCLFFRYRVFQQKRSTQVKE